MKKRKNKKKKKKKMKKQMKKPMTSLSHRNDFDGSFGRFVWIQIYAMIVFHH